MNLKKLSFGLFEKVTLLFLAFPAVMLFINRDKVDIFMQTGVLMFIMGVSSLLNMRLLKNYTFKTKLFSFIGIVLVESILFVLYNQGFDNSVMLENTKNFNGVTVEVMNGNFVELVFSTFLPLYSITVLFSGFYDFVVKKMKFKKSKLSY